MSAPSPHVNSGVPQVGDPCPKPTGEEPLEGKSGASSCGYSSSNSINKVAAEKNPKSAYFVCVYYNINGYFDHFQQCLCNLKGCPVK